MLLRDHAPADGRKPAVGGQPGTPRATPYAVWKIVGPHVCKTVRPKRWDGMSLFVIRGCPRNFSPELRQLREGLTGRCYWPMAGRVVSVACSSTSGTRCMHGTRTWPHNIISETGPIPDWFKGSSVGGFWWGEGDEKPSVGGEKERGPGIGDEYDGMIAGVKKQLANLKTDFPALADRGYEIAGFGWHQGWQDGCSMADTLAYEKNMVNFIKDVRKDLGVPTLPFVIGGSGFGGWEQKVDRRLKIMEAQNAVADLPEFKDTVRYVETRSFYRPPEESPSKYRYHWNDNAETYYLIGAFGE
jgi:hypothetical protein